MSTTSKYQIPDEEIEAAFARPGGACSRLLFLATTGDMNNPLKIQIGVLVTEHRTLIEILKQDAKKEAELRRQNQSLCNLVNEYRQENKELRREVERLAAQGALA